MIIFLSGLGNTLLDETAPGLFSKHSLKIGHQKTSFLKVMSSVRYATVFSRITCGEQHRKRKSENLPTLEW